MFLEVNGPHPSRRHPHPTQGEGQGSADPGGGRAPSANLVEFQGLGGQHVGEEVRVAAVEAAGGASEMEGASPASVHTTMHGGQTARV